MKTFHDDFMLPPESSIQDAFDGIEHWKKVIAVGTKYSISVSGNSVKLKASWPSKSGIGGNLLNPINPLTNIIRLSGATGGPEMTIELTFTEMIGGVHANALLSEAINRGMGDYRSLKTHLSTRSGVPDRAFDRYLTEQTKKPEPEPEPEPVPELGELEDTFAEIQQGPTQNCPNCNSEIAISGIVRPDGSVLCPKCFKKFMI